MTAKLRKITDYKDANFQNVSKYLIGIVVSEYHADVCNNLKEGSLKTLQLAGVPAENIEVRYVPGAYEIPLAARWLYDSDEYDAIICLGCVIKGETDHDFFINDAISKKLIDMSLEDDTPYIFGVLTVNNKQQALDRAGGKHGNKGEECALAALKMLQLRDSLSTPTI